MKFSPCSGRLGWHLDIDRSVVRFTDFVMSASRPSDESLGYYQPSAKRTEAKTRLCAKPKGAFRKFAEAPFAAIQNRLMRLFFFAGQVALGPR